MQSVLQAIAYLNLQISTSTSASIATVSSLASYPMHLYHPQYALWFQMCNCKRLCIQSGQAKAYVFTARPGSHWYIHQEAFIMFSQSPDVHRKKTKLTSAQKKSPSCIQQGFHPHRYQEMLENNILHASTSGWSARRLTTWIIRISVDKSTPFYIHTFVRRSDVPQVRGATDSIRRLIA